MTSAALAAKGRKVHEDQEGGLGAYSDKFFRNLRFAMEQRGVRAGALATAIGVDGSTVSQWFRRKSPPDLDTIGEIAKYLKVSVNWLVTGDIDGFDEADEAQASVPPDDQRMLEAIAARLGFEFVRLRRRDERSR